MGSQHECTNEKEYFKGRFIAKAWHLAGIMRSSLAIDAAHRRHKALRGKPSTGRFGARRMWIDESLGGRFFHAHKKAASMGDLFISNYLCALLFNGAGTRSRTRDLLITSQLLYQLS